VTTTTPPAAAGRGARTGRPSRVVVGIAAVAAGLGLATARFIDSGGDRAPEPLTAATASSPAERVAQLERATAAAPDDHRLWQQLAVAYVQGVAAGADLSDYNLAERALTRAEALAPGEPANALAGGYLALARHDFARAHELGLRAHRANPANPDALAVLVDSAVELGHYDEAVMRAQQLLDRKPGLAAHSRTSYIRELHGDIDGARQAFAQAEIAGAGSSFDVASVAMLRGKLAVAHGDLATAEKSLKTARRLVPDVGGGDALETRLLIAQGRLEAALAVAEEGFDAAPSAETALLICDLLVHLGREAETAPYDEFLRANLVDERAAGADVDLEAGLIELDRGNIAAGLESARTAYEHRPDNVFTASGLAWALRANGDPRGALPFVEQSLRLGSRDAMFRYRAAVIYAEAGQPDRAAEELRTAFDINPLFSMRFLGDAVSLADELGVAVPELPVPINLGVL
jgi:tetratricopeptide (TPR) repeat protein